MKKISILFIGLSLILTSCGSSKKSVSKPISKTENPAEVTENEVDVVSSKEESSMNLTTQLYINKFAETAKEEMQIYKIPASITLAQGILESNSGNSDLTKQSNNHFGIKCHKKWTGKTIFYDDDTKNECFRVYEEPASSFKDHSVFLSSRRRYSGLFALDKGDYIAWAQGLREAGYATDRDYPKKLIKIINKYKLYKYDKEVLGDAYEAESKNTLSYVVKSGETLTDIARMKGVKLEELKRINHLMTDKVMVGQKILLKPENDLLEESYVVTNLDNSSDSNVNNPDFHVVQQGESLFGISRRYKMSIKRIRKYNNLNSNDIQIGQKLYLHQVDRSVSHPVVHKPVVKQEEVVVYEQPKSVEVEETVVETPVNQDIEVESVEKPEKSVVSQEESKKVEVATYVEPEQPKTVKLIRKKTVPDYHTVAKGETLYGIAYKYNLSIPELRKLNHIKKNTIRIGQQLKLKRSVASQASYEIIEPQVPTDNKSNTTTSSSYRVVKGDTLYSIATRNKMSVSQLKRLNHLTGNGIYVGQILLLE